MDLDDEAAEQLRKAIKDRESNNKGSTSIWTQSDIRRDCQSDLTEPIIPQFHHFSIPIGAQPLVQKYG